MSSATSEDPTWELLREALSGKKAHTNREIDFSKVEDVPFERSGITRDAVEKTPPPITADGKLLTPKQIRARARRRAKRGKDIVTQEEFDALYKPIEEWDVQELARGRPRNAKGDFAGRTPRWVTREVHEKANEQFLRKIREGMNERTVDSLDVIKEIMTNNEVDDKGKPIVPAGTKLDAAKFLLEHVVGKPTQRVEGELSVKLQAILGVAMANPAEAFQTQAHGGEGYEIGHFPGVTMPMMTEEVEDADVIDDGE